MDTQKIAVPTQISGKRSNHFGHCQQFTLVEIENNVVTSISFLDNPPHPPNGCMQPVALLKKNKVDSIIVGGMGAKPFNKFREAGINVYFADRVQFPDVQSAIDSLLTGKLTPMVEQQLCRGSGNCHQYQGKS